MRHTTLAATLTLLSLLPACQAQTQIVYVETSGAHGGPTERPELDPEDDSTTTDAGEESTSTGEPDEETTSTGTTSIGVEDTAGEETTSSTSGAEESTTGTTGEPEETTSSTGDETTDEPIEEPEETTGEPMPPPPPPLLGLGEACLEDAECESYYCGAQQLGGGSRCTLPCDPQSDAPANDCTAQGAGGLCLAHAGGTLWHCDGMHLPIGTDLADDIELEIGATVQHELGVGDIDLVRIDKNTGPYVAVIKPTGGAVLAYTMYQHDGVVLQTYEAAPGEPLVVMPGVDPVVGVRWLAIRNTGAAGGWALTSSPGNLPHYEECEVDAECSSGYCRASGFDVVRRCLTPCSRGEYQQAGHGLAIDNCSAMGLPGLCVETGEDSKLMCAGDMDLKPLPFAPGVTDHHLPIKIGPDFAYLGEIDNDADADVFVLDIPINTTNVYFHVDCGGNDGQGSVRATWLDTTGTTIKSAVKPGNPGPWGILGPVSGPARYYVLVELESGTPGPSGLTYGVYATIG